MVTANGVAKCLKADLEERRENTARISKSKLREVLAKYSELKYEKSRID